MKILKNKVSVLFFLFIFGLASGVQWHRLYLFPFPQLHELVNPAESVHQADEKIVVSFYEAKTPVFSDRPYYDSVGDYRLNDLLLLQISRHRSKDIIIEADVDITIYRFISNDNTNENIGDWSVTNIPIKVKGGSTTHTLVVKKSFHPGKIILESGGSVSSSPILISPKNYTPQNFGFRVLI